MCRFSKMFLVKYVQRRLYGDDQRDYIPEKLVRSFLKKNKSSKSMNKLVLNAVAAINKYNYWHFIKNYNPKFGYMYADNNFLTILNRELDSDGHSGCSFAITIRIVQKMINDEKLEFKCNNTCPICLLDIDNEEHFIYTDCAHLYHKNCLDKWQHHTCPTCRKNIIKT